MSTPILQIGKSYPFLQVGFWKKPSLDVKPSYYTEQHLFDPEKDRLQQIHPHVLTVVGIEYDIGRYTSDGFIRSYKLQSGTDDVWYIYFPEEDKTKEWRAFELIAHRQGTFGIAAGYAEEVLTAYCRRNQQRAKMLSSSGNALWSDFYTKLCNIMTDQFQLNPEVYPLVSKTIHEITMHEVPCVRLVPVCEEPYEPTSESEFGSDHPD